MRKATLTVLMLTALALAAFANSPMIGAWSWVRTVVS